MRLCYGADRYSEDLNFVGGEKFVAADLMEMKNCLEKYIGQRYGFDINVQMSRFLPLSVQERTLQKPKFIDFLINETNALFLDVRSLLDESK